MKSRFELLWERVHRKYENGDPGHDLAHIRRVLAMCCRIGEKAGANLDVLLPAALLHDVVNVPKNHPDRTKASRQAATVAVEFLREHDYTEEECGQIAQVIVEHSYSLGLKPSTLESAILQDADRLDAIGAIGVMRTTTCGSRMGSKYYDMMDPFAKERALDDKSFTLDHFFVKLFQLAEGMNTEEGKAEAKRRADFMRLFVEQLRAEITQ